MGAGNGFNPEGVRLAGKKTGWPHWTTPEDVLDVVRELGRIVLDPCSNEHAQVHAIMNFTEGGLEKNWLEHVTSHPGITFVNPPYNQATAFVDKCITEGAAGCEIVLLVAARTDTKWAHRIFNTADMLCFWGPGRIKFGNPPPESAGDAPSIPSMFAYWGGGKNPAAFWAAFQKRGHVVNLARARERRTFPVSVLP